MDLNLPSLEEYHAWGQSVGPMVDPTPAAMPLPNHLRGRYVELRSPTDEDLEDLWISLGKGRENDRHWTYLRLGPYRDFSPSSSSSSDVDSTETSPESEERMKAAFLADLKEMRDDPLHCYYTIVPISSDSSRGKAQGAFSLFNAELTNRSIELGWVMLAPSLRGTRVATEAFYLVMQRALRGDPQLGKQVLVVDGEERLTTFRRLEWKCHSLNRPSRSAAERLGFTFEGTFRQHVILKSRNRDSTWFSILDSEWPLLEKSFQLWLEPENFTSQDHAAREKVGLREIRLRLKKQEEEQGEGKGEVKH